ncbi:hypothetical protein PP187_gp136 [Klebsiella phage vB_KvM-Eowyn]|uniref:Uncharacterized protein n=1 Tax=Klebsiella phage vB_KvM-Eowyn TaxID=2762819 RepID=A0A7R8R5G2_9CAUD|nr:hypothetical protein PP187_gp136 [Klebsiella phage vB_KvM-Eowyn]CAD5236125.1 hypothetical protein LLCLJKAH_00136 [Klebsiella phage vB_KvM-Eowyn]
MSDTSQINSLLESNNITAVCFYSNLHGKVQLTHTSVPLKQAMEAVDASMNNIYWLTVLGERTMRPFYYGTLKGRLVLMETALKNTHFFSQFVEDEPRTASWRKSVRESLIC